MLRTQFKMEMMIYTQDRMYKDSLRMLKIKEEEQERQTYGVASPPSRGLYDYNEDNEATLEELACHLNTYFGVSRYK